MRFVSNFIWLSLMLCTTLKPNSKFCMGLTNIEGIERLECICVYLSRSKLSGNLHYFVFNSAQSSGKKKNGNVTVKNCFKESLLSILCFIIHRKGSSEKGFFLNCQKFI